MDLPAWLQDFIVEDALVGQAYETTPAQVRASLKKTIACLSCLYGEQPLEKETKQSFRQGVTISQKDTPAPLCFVVCPSDFQYPEQFIAALLPAVFAGVHHIVPCFLSMPNKNNIINPSLLAAADIAGIETVFMLTKEEFMHKLDAFEGDPSLCRIIEIHSLAPTRSTLTICSLIPHVSLFSEKEILPQKKISEGNSINFFSEGLLLSESFKDIWAWPQLNTSWFITSHISFTDTSY